MDKEKNYEDLAFIDYLSQIVLNEYEKEYKIKQEKERNKENEEK